MLPYVVAGVFEATMAYPSQAKNLKAICTTTAERTLHLRAPRRPKVTDSSE